MNLFNINIMFLKLQIRSLDRPMDVPDRGMVCDLLWSDPDEVNISSFPRKHKKIALV